MQITKVCGKSSHIYTVFEMLRCVNIYQKHQIYSRKIYKLISVHILQQQEKFPSYSVKPYYYAATLYSVFTNEWCSFKS